MNTPMSAEFLCSREPSSFFTPRKNPGRSNITTPLRRRYIRVFFLPLPVEFAWIVLVQVHVLSSPRVSCKKE